MRITGILLPSDWDEDGQVTSLVLATSDEAVFRIETTRPPEQFKKFIRKKVVVDGTLAAAGSLKLDTIGFCNADQALVGDNTHLFDPPCKNNQPRKENMK